MNLLFGDVTSQNFDAAGMLSSDGVCKTFEARADGYGRGEGCGVMFVKPLADALADGNRVYGVIAGSCVNQDGRSNVLTAPNGPAQEAVIAGAWADAGVSGRDVVYVEAHGTGTPLGDPIEMGALSNALEAAGVSGRGAVGVGAAKRVFGHTEAAAGMVGLIKCALSVWHGSVPGGVALSGAVNELISVDGVLSIVEGSGMSGLGSGAVVGVSSFGFGGTNAHVVVRGHGSGKGAGEEVKAMRLWDHSKSYWWPEEMLRGDEDGAEAEMGSGVDVLDGEHGVLGVKHEMGDGSVVWRRVMDGSKWIEDAWVNDHVVGGNVVVPGAWTFQVMALAAHQLGRAAEGIELHTLLPGTARQVEVIAAGDKLRVASRGTDGGEWVLHASAQMTTKTESSTGASIPSEEELDRWRYLAGEDVRSLMRRTTVSLGPGFSGCDSVWMEQAASGRMVSKVIVLESARETMREGYVISPETLDACFQGLGCGAISARGALSLGLPSLAKSVQIGHRTNGGIVWALGVWNGDELDVEVVDEDGMLIIRLRGIGFREMEVETQPMRLYSWHWEPASEVQLTRLVPAVDSGPWTVVFLGGSSVEHTMAVALSKRLAAAPVTGTSNLLAVLENAGAVRVVVVGSVVEELLRVSRGVVGAGLGGQLVIVGESSDAARLGGMWGLGRVVRSEGRAFGLGVRMVSFDDVGVEVEEVIAGEIDSEGHGVEVHVGRSGAMLAHRYEAVKVVAREGKEDKGGKDDKEGKTDGWWLVVGGSSGFGASIVEWLAVERGGASSGCHESQWAGWQECSGDGCFGAGS